ncbi:hypothetical protein ZIOFF_008586 [Zingiber officinale]|uniref:MAPK kinase substrate protein n=1 Tax=Zingiber officinale TaxID=94328 RepID=A0A8J5HWC8_ZINOF|nr:hypothetical protein ZIOFF_008586 [Zingiber officinale]
MAELRRSETTFRRSGSSGVVWDETFLSSIKKHRENGSGLPEGQLRQRAESSSRRSSRSPFQAHVDAGDISPAADSPSPRALCFCCPIPGKNNSTKPPRPRKR